MSCLQILGFPTVLPLSLKSMTVLGVSLLLILSKCAAHCSLPTLIVLVITGDQENWHNSCFYLILHSPVWCTGPYILYYVFLTKVRSSFDCVNVHFSLPCARLGLRVLYILTFISQASNLQCLCSP
jgi:hypothetical protein